MGAQQAYANRGQPAASTDSRLRCYGGGGSNGMFTMNEYDAY